MASLEMIQDHNSSINGYHIQDNKLYSLQVWKVKHCLKSPMGVLIVDKDKKCYRDTQLVSKSTQIQICCHSPDISSVIWMSQTNTHSNL